MSALCGAGKGGQSGFSRAVNSVGRQVATSPASPGGAEGGGTLLPLNFLITRQPSALAWLPCGQRPVLCGSRPIRRSTPLKARASASAKDQSERQVIESETELSGPFWTQCGAITGTNSASPGPIAKAGAARAPARRATSVRARRRCGSLRGPRRGHRRASPAGNWVITFEPRICSSMLCSGSKW